MSRRATFASYGLPLAAATVSIALLAFSLLHRNDSRIPGVVGVGAVLISSLAAMVPSLLSRKSLKRLSERGQVFVIYDHRDAEEARHIADAIREAGFTPWMASEQINKDDNASEAITNALNASAATVVVLTDRAPGLSKWMLFELSTALGTSYTLDTGQSPVLPVLFGQATLPRELLGIQSLRMDGGAGDSTLTASLRRIFSRES